MPTHNDDYRKEWNAEMRDKLLKDKYKEYVKNCHSKIGVFVSEFSFDEWLEADEPDGKQ